MLPSPLTRRLAIFVRPLSTIFATVDFFLFPLIGITVVRPQPHGNSPGQTEACDEAGQCDFLLRHRARVHHQEQLFSPLFVQQIGDLLTLALKVSTLPMVWARTYPPVPSCSCTYCVPPSQRHNIPHLSRNIHRKRRELSVQAHIFRLADDPFLWRRLCNSYFGVSAFGKFVIFPSEITSSVDTYQSLQIVPGIPAPVRKGPKRGPLCGPL